MYTKLTQDQEVFKYTNGTSLSDYLTGVSYYQLVNALGEPTFSTPSEDDKVQKEWVFKDAEGNGFTIYDWKTYDESYTVDRLKVWNVGSKVGVADFILWVESRLSGTINL